MSHPRRARDARTCSPTKPGEDYVNSVHVIYKIQRGSVLCTGDDHIVVTGPVDGGFYLRALLIIR